MQNNKKDKIYSDIQKTTHTRSRLTALCPGLPGWASTRKVKPIWILLKQETASGSGISLAICKSALRSRQITTPASHHSVFTCQMLFLPPNQQRQSTEGNILGINLHLSDCLITTGPILTKFLCMLPMAVARSSSGGVVIRYVLPVLRMRHLCS